MGVFDFLFGRKNEFKITFLKDEKLFRKDVVVGDVVKLWKPKGKGQTIISYYDKAIEERVGYKLNSQIALYLDQEKEYVAYISKISGFYITVTIIFDWEDINLKEFEIPLPEKYKEFNKERYERRAKRFEEIQRIAEEKRALVQPQYDKVLNIHQKKFDEFTEKFVPLKESKNIKKLEKLLIDVEKELERVETKEDKRSDVFCGRSDKWQESEKGELYEDITNELSNLWSDVEEIRDEIKEIINNLS